MVLIVNVLLLFLLIIAVDKIANANDNSIDNSNDRDHHQELLIDWVRSKEGGYWNPKQDIRNGGVFANQAITQNELLASIPWECVIETNNDAFETCHLVKSLSQEMQKKKESQFEPFIRVLKDVLQQQRPTNDASMAASIPSYWSKEGQELLLEITGHGSLPPEDPLMKDNEWKNDCDLIDADATLLVQTHAEDFGMVPLSSQYNSRGGNWTNAYFSMEGRDDDGSTRSNQTTNTYNSDGIYLESNAIAETTSFVNEHLIAVQVRAYRNIPEGEEITTDYRDYGDIGTPELLRDFGFVELYPQRWIFTKQNVAFDVDVVIMNTNLQPPQPLLWQLEYLEGYDNDDVNTVSNVTFFRDELKRLNDLDLNFRIRTATKLRKAEANVIEQYYRGLTTALSLVVRENNKNVVYGMDNNEGRKAIKDEL